MEPVYSRDILEKIQSGILIIDLKTHKVIDVNKSALKMLKRQRKTVIGSSCYDLFCKGTSTECPRENGKMTDSPIEQKLVRRDGTEIPVLLTCSEVIIQRRRKLIVNINDLSSLVSTRMELEQERNKIKRYLDIADVLIVTVGTDGKVQMINQRGAKVLGYPQRNIIGKDWFDNFISPSMREQLRTIHSCILEGEIEPYRYVEGTILTKTGEERLIAWRNAPVYSDEGIITATISSGMDITERRIIEQSLRENEMRTRKILDSIQTGVVIVDAKTRKIVEANPAAHRILEVEHGKLIGTDCRDSLCASDECLGSQKNFVNVEVECKSGKGNPIYVLKNVSRMLIGEQVFLIEAFLDLSDRKAAENELQSVNHRLKERIKEIQTLLRTSELVHMANTDLDSVFEKIPRIIQDGFQYPEITHVRITVNDRSYFSRDFKASNWQLSTPISFQEEEFGSIDVFYVEEKPDEDEGPFLKEERDLLNALGQQIGTVIYQKQIEAAIDKERRLLDTLTNTTLDAIILMDPEGKIAYWNHSAQVIFGYTPEEAIGKHLHYLLAPKRYHNAYREAFKEFLQTGKGNAIGKVVELHGRRKDGSEFPIELSLSAFHDIKGWNAVGSIRDSTDRQKAMEAIKESERRYRDLIDLLPEGVAIGDLDETIVLANKAMAMLVGLNSAEELIGRNLVDFIDEKDRLMLEAETNRRGSGAVSSYTLHFRDVHNNIKEVYVSAVPRRNNEGEVIGAVGVFVDVTERRRTERELRRTSYNLQKRMKEIQALFNISDLLKVTQTSKRSKTSRSELLFRIISEVIGALQYPHVGCGRISVGSDVGETANYQSEAISVREGIWAGGSQIGVIEVGYTELMPEADEGPFLDEEIGLIRKISVEIGLYVEREIAEEALEEQRKTLGAITNSTFDAIVMVDWDGKIAYWNPAAERIFGYKPSNILGKTVHSICEGISQITETQSVEDSDSVVESKILELEAIREDGTRFPAEVAMAPILIGDKYGTLMNIRDISERKSIEREREQQQRELELYASLLRHDLGNDLNAIVSNMEVVRMLLEEDPDEAREFLHSSFAAAQRMDNLLKSVSRSPLMTKMDFVEMLREVARITEKSARGTTIRITTNGDLSGIRVSGSRLLPTVFENLFRNSIQHSDKSPKIDVSLQREGDILEIIVQDNGPGIPKEIRENLFERGVSTKKQGGGVGLYLSKEIVRACNGTIEALESESGKGAKFRIVLPTTEYYR